jgi:putative SbcD/Mre11-related phosphoesterase
MIERQTENGVFEFKDWRLTPEGAAIHRVERTAIVADLHLGYEWARGASGDCVIAHSLDETRARLARVLERAPLARLVVAGDLVESARPCARTLNDVRQLRRWLAERGVELLTLEGNHDERLCRPGERNRPSVASLQQHCAVASWTIGHGHRPIPGKRTISGHHHPVLGIERTVAPCFLVGPRNIVLPAFSANAAGCDVARAAVPREWLTIPLRCLASTGCEVLDFGPLTELRRRFRPTGRRLGRKTAR